MASQANSPQYERTRKFLLVLPALAVPFLTGFFFLLGGGKGTVMAATKAPGSAGFNMNLPTARLKDDKGLNKMSFYEQADKDSANFKEKMNKDPYFGRSGNNGPGLGAVPGDGSLAGIKYNLLKQHPELNSAVGGSSFPSGATAGRGADPNEEKVYEKIAQLNQAMNAPAPVRPTSYLVSPPGSPSPDVHADVDRLERMLQNLKEGGSATSDPQMQQWSGMLDKILQIQNPPNRDSLQRLSIKNKGKAYPVSSSAGQADSISLLQGPDTNASSLSANPAADSQNPIGFYSLDDKASANTEQNVITAAIDESQTLVTGADVKMRLTADMYVNGTLIPAGTPVTGMANLSGERLKVQVSSIRFQNAIYPVGLAVYDVDGVAGIYIPGSINRDVSKESADQALGEMNMMSMDPSVGAQAASAGIQAAKTLISRKIKLVRVTVKDGYQVFLKESGN